MLGLRETTRRNGRYMYKTRYVLYIYIYVGWKAHEHHFLCLRGQRDWDGNMWTWWGLLSVFPITHLLHTHTLIISFPIIILFLYNPFLKPNNSFIFPLSYYMLSYSKKKKKQRWGSYRDQSVRKLNHINSMHIWQLAYDLCSKEKMRNIQFG